MWNQFTRKNLRRNKISSRSTTIQLDTSMKPSQIRIRNTSRKSMNKFVSRNVNIKFLQEYLLNLTIQFENKITRYDKKDF